MICWWTFSLPFLLPWTFTAHTSRHFHTVLISFTQTVVSCCCVVENRIANFLLRSPRTFGKTFTQFFFGRKFWTYYISGLLFVMNESNWNLAFWKKFHRDSYIIVDHDSYRLSFICSVKFTKSFVCYLVHSILAEL